MRNLDIGLLRTFVAVAERENFTSAAEKVYRTQAAVSQQMQKLEAVLQCTLFERVGRRKKLTAEGMRLLEYARRMVSLNDEAYRVVTQQEFTQPVKIGSCADAVDTLMPAYLEICAENFPKLSIDIQVGRSRWLASALRKGDIDLMVDIAPHPEFAHTVLRTSPVAWIAGARYHPQAGASVPLILMEAACPFRSSMVQALADARIPWHLAFETSTLAGVRAALRAGLGITARTVEMLAPDLRVLDPLARLPALPPISFALYWRADADNESAMKVRHLIAPP
ncbi:MULTISPECIES: LysR substrate-binding domain-containing protein [unclassified Achromobacter]|uniref:LysR substrate-binding domain-containing protein n=1 Tax=unclassified Achromobacter TaxID=2626865 RepID=UPI00069EDF0A|nr:MULTISPECIES: LysR substrate-binding domain-containing protein [unclassified Achromobacter]KOF52174.1 LysR family transcriptional regulator [Achromobacter sp. DMS1]